MSHSRGQALVELALILPILLILVLAAIDLGRLYASKITIESAAREGAMEASRDPSSYQDGAACDKTTNRVMCRVQNEVRGSFLDGAVQPADVTLTCNPKTDCRRELGNRVIVGVEADFSLVSPILAVFTGGQTFTLTSTASAQIGVAPVLGAVTLPTPTPEPTPPPTPTPTPEPTPPPTPGPGATPTPPPTPTPEPTLPPTPEPTPSCATPTASFTVAPTSGRKNDTTFVFTDTSTYGLGCEPIMSWSFGDGSAATSGPIVSRVYKLRGQYTVTLVITLTYPDPDVADTTTRTVTVTN